ncbi:ribosomal large subunit pseudouridine synthase D [Loktanella atrilutea]|uniref:Pseudouridine synthase n=1 Tax=Loktanella atrilutea TaxID=366533 RepID=A0A1M5AUQ9_LOKAT|nr:RluA family pseudouridine synthase [Loktanella atrilutea]SHF33672.1 ribosomal large subunit pseudouridine synthase D [Loktanella atrilutea]
MAERVTFQIDTDPPARLDKALARDVPEDAVLSRSRLSRLIVEGAVEIDGTVVTDPRARVAEGAAVAITVEDAQDSHIAPQYIALDIVHEDADLIVLNKPAGMVVHPAPGSPDGTLVNALIHHCGDDLSGVGGMKRPGIVHRIDKETSGLLVVAKSDAAHQGLAAQFAAHTVQRRYLAVCFGVPDANDPRLRGVKGTSFEPGNILKIQTLLGRHRTDRQKQAVSFQSGRHAVTRVRIVEPLGTPAVAALVECWLETGRTHQIRVHLAHCGHGLIGDPVYGGRQKLAARAVGEGGVAAARAFPRQALHAATLGFVHPVSGETLEFAADLPEDMAQLLRDLRRQG